MTVGNGEYGDGWIDELWAAPTPEPGPDFWSGVRSVLDDQVPAGRDPHRDENRRRLLVAVAVAVLVVVGGAAAWWRTAGSGRIETVAPGIEELATGGESPAGPFDYVAQAALSGGEILLVTQVTDEQAPCYPPDEPGGSGAQPGVVVRLMAVDMVNGGEPVPVTDYAVDAYTAASAPTVVPGPQRFAVFNHCQGTARQLAAGFVGRTSTGAIDIQLTSLDLPADVDFILPPVWMSDGVVLGVPAGENEGSTVTRSRLLSYDAEDGTLIGDEEVDTVPVVELSDGRTVSRDLGLQSGTEPLYLDGAPVQTDMAPLIETVRPSPDGRRMAVIGSLMPVSGVVVFDADEPEPVYQLVGERVADVAWLANEMMVVAIGQRNEVSRFEVVDFGLLPDAPADSRGEPSIWGVGMEMDGLIVRSMVPVVGDRLAVSGSRGRVSDATWFLPAGPIRGEFGSTGQQAKPPGDAGQDYRTGDEVEVLLPAAVDIGPDWSRGAVKVLGPDTVLFDPSDESSACGPDRAVVVPYGYAVEYQFGSKPDEATAIAVAGPPDDITRLAEGLLALVACDRPELDPVDATTAAATVTAYQGGAVARLDDRLLWVDVGPDHPELDVGRIVADIMAEVPDSTRPPGSD